MLTLSRSQSEHLLHLLETGSLARSEELTAGAVTVLALQGDGVVREVENHMTTLTSRLRELAQRHVMYASSEQMVSIKLYM